MLQKLSSVTMGPAEAYAPMRKSPALFESILRDEWLAPSVWGLVAAAQAGVWDPELVREECEGVYSFELFTEAFCDVLMAEVDAYAASGLPVRRPNSMNNYGLIVNEIGLRPAITELQQAVLLPVARLLFGPTTYASQFDGHHSFMVSYEANKDAGLDMHTDDSDVTFNVCLGKEGFTGAGLTFCGSMGSRDHRQFDARYAHVRGRCVAHLGTKRHGADDITSGERRNLIIWNQNYAYRRSALYKMRSHNYQKEGAPPDPRCLSYTHDRDYGAFKALDDPRMGAANQRAWCPPHHVAYDGFDEALDRMVADNPKFYLDQVLQHPTGDDPDGFLASGDDDEP